MRFVMPDPLPKGEDTKAARREIAEKENAVRQAFAEHNARILPFLPPALKKLQTTDLHDGIWRGLRIDAAAKTLVLRLLCGDLVQGYFNLQLTYTGITLSPMETNLLCIIAHEETTEIDDDEIDIEKGVGNAQPQFIHRIAWHTGIPTWRETLPNKTRLIHTLYPEMEFRFTKMTLRTSPVSNERATALRYSRKRSANVKIVPISAEE